MPSSLDRTHHLESDGFAPPFRTLVERVLPDATTAVVELEMDELAMEPDGEACRRRWNDIQPHFERVINDSGQANDSRALHRDSDGRAAWRCDVTPESDGRAALVDLVDLTDGIAGSHFVATVELRDGDTPLLEAVPHHADAGVDASRLTNEIEPDEIVGLDGHSACLVPVETAFEWRADDRRWRVGGGSLCVETLDGRTTNCYGLTNLQRATVAADGSVLELAWEAGGLPDDVIGRLLGWVMDRLYDPPTAVPCGTSTRAASLRAYLADLLAAYDGRGLY